MPCHIRDGKDLTVDIFVNQVYCSLIVERDVPRILLCRALSTQLHDDRLERFSELQWCWILLLSRRYTPRQPTLIGKNCYLFIRFPQLLKLLKTPWHKLPVIDVLRKGLAAF